MNLRSLSLLGYVGMVGTLVTLLITRSLFSRSWVAIAFQAMAVMLFFWARITFGLRSFHVQANPTEGGLVTTGPYRYIRHPIYAAMCLVAGVGAAAHSSWTSALLFVVMLSCALLRIYCEEALVSQRYPEYKQYSSTTARMIPFLF